MIIGIVGYFTIPTVSNWIVQAGGLGGMNKNINQTAGKAGSVGGAVAGATAGNIAGKINEKVKTKIMEFKSLKTSKPVFKQLRLFGIVFLCLCAGIVDLQCWSSYSFAENQRQRIYVLDGGNR